MSGLVADFLGGLVSGLVSGLGPDLVSSPASSLPLVSPTNTKFHHFSPSMFVLMSSPTQ